MPDEGGRPGSAEETGAVNREVSCVENVVPEGPPQLRDESAQDTAFVEGQGDIGPETAGKGRKGFREEAEGHGLPRRAFRPPDVPDGRPVVEIPRCLKDRIKSRVCELSVQRMAPVSGGIRILVGGITDKARRRSQVILEEAGCAERGRVVGQVETHRLHRVVIEIDREPGVEMQQVQRLAVGPGDEFAGGRRGREGLREGAFLG